MFSQWPRWRISTFRGLDVARPSGGSCQRNIYVKREGGKMPKPNEKSSGSTFVGKVVKDPKKHVAALLLSGFLGPSSEKDHTRLYFDAQLSQYVEIPDQAILHSE